MEQLMMLTGGTVIMAKQNRIWIFVLFLLALAISVSAAENCTQENPCLPTPCNAPEDCPPIISTVIDSDLNCSDQHNYVLDIPQNHYCAWDVTIDVNGAAVNNTVVTYAFHTGNISFICSNTFNTSDSILCSGTARTTNESEELVAQVIRPSEGVKCNNSIPITYSVTYFKDCSTSTRGETHTPDGANYNNFGSKWNTNGMNLTLKTFIGTEGYNSTYDFTKDGVVNQDDLDALTFRKQSFDGSFFLPLIDFNAEFGIYEELLDYTLGFVAYMNKIIRGAMPSEWFITTNDDNQCSDDDVNDLSCNYCNNNGFCDINEWNYLGIDCADCDGVFPVEPYYDGFQFYYNNEPIPFNKSPEIIGPYETSWGNEFGKITFVTGIDYTKKVNGSYVALNITEALEIRNGSLLLNTSVAPQLGSTGVVIDLYNVNFIHYEILKNGGDCGCITSNGTPNLTFFTGVESVNGLFNITVIDNDHPTEFLENIPDIEDRNGTQQIVINVSDYFNDSDVGKANLTYGYNASVTDIVVDFVVQNPNLVQAVIMPLNRYFVGAFSMMFTAFEPGPVDGNVAESNWFDFIFKDDRPPVLNNNIPDITINEDNNFILNLGSYLSDPDGHDLTYSYSFIGDATNISIYDLNPSALSIWWNITNAVHSEESGFNQEDHQIYFETMDGSEVYGYIYVPSGVGYAGPMPVDNPVGLRLRFKHTADGTLQTDNITFDEGIIDITYDNDKTLSIPVPEINLSPEEELILYIGADGSTYYDLALTQLAREAPLIASDSVLIEPDANWFGQRAVKFKANDGIIQTSSNNVLITVNSVNDDPEVIEPIDDIIINEDENAFIFLANHFFDVDVFNPVPDVLNYSASGEDNVNISFNETHAIIEPNTDWNGFDDVNIRVTDSFGVSNETSFTVYVLEESDPVIRNIVVANMTWEEDTVYDLNLTKYFTDSDNDASYSFSELSSDNLTVAISSITGLGTITPDPNWFGVATIKFSAFDDESDAFDIFTLNVTPINDAPILIESIPNQTWPMDMSRIINISDYFADGWNENESCDLTYDIANKVGDINVTILGGCPFKVFAALNPINNYSGIGSIMFNATDGNFSINSNVIVLNVTDDFTRPVVSDNSTDAWYDNPATIWVTAVDISGVKNIKYCFANSACVPNIIEDTNGFGDVTIPLSIDCPTGCEQTVFYNAEDLFGFMSNTSNFTVKIAPNSTVVNSTINDSSIINSTVINSTIINSTVINSNKINAVVINSFNKDSTVTDSTEDNSSLINCTYEESTINDSDDENSVVYGAAEIDPSWLFNNNYYGLNEIIDSVIGYCNLSDSTIINSALFNCETEFLLLENGNIVSGVVIINGTVYTSSNGTGFTDINENLILDKFEEDPEEPVTPPRRGGRGGGGRRCVENWNCSDWGDCFVSGFRFRSCKDLNECGTYFSRPAEREPCEYEMPPITPPVTPKEPDVREPTQIEEPTVEEPQPKEGLGIWPWIIIALIIGVLVYVAVVAVQRQQSARPDLASLEESIISVLDHGFTKEDVKSSLVSKGWPESMVDEALHDLLLKRHDIFEPHNKVVLLKKGVKNIVAHGYSIDQVKQKLLEKGWDKEIVNRVIGNIKK